MLSLYILYMQLHLLYIIYRDYYTHTGYQLIGHKPRLNSSLSMTSVATGLGNSDNSGYI